MLYPLRANWPLEGLLLPLSDHSVNALIVKEEAAKAAPSKFGFTLSMFLVCPDSAVGHPR